MKRTTLGFKTYVPEEQVVAHLADALNENTHLPKVENAILGIIEAMDLHEEVQTYIRKNF